MWPSASPHLQASQRRHSGSSTPSRHILALAAIALALSTICFQSALAKEQAPLAFLDSGLIISGALDDVNQVSYWEGVRYALKPTGNNRFAPPQGIDDETQKTAPAPTKNQSPKKKKHDGDNAAIGIAPPFNFDAIAQSGLRFINATSILAQKAWNLTSSIANAQAGDQRLIFQQRRSSSNKISATKPGPRCPQDGRIENQDEDCLYLNIYRPTDNDVTPLPVLLFIHGGGWMGGAGSDYDPTSIVKTSYLSDVPIMVVTINYRLGILGFGASSDLATLSNIDPRGCAESTDKCTSRDASVESAGLNLGYQDMKMAINWTFSNIAAFGGDPGKITIWGQSAGAFGVSAMLVGHQGAALGADRIPYQSNPPRPPFRGAIMMSGAPSGAPLPRPVDRDVFWNEALSAVECDPVALATPQARLDCIRKADWKDLRKVSIAQRNETDWNVQHERYALASYPWTPVLDGGAGRGGFFGDPPSVTLAKGTFARVPFITGNVEDEGTLFAPEDFLDATTFDRWLTAITFANTSISLAVSNDLLYGFDKLYPDDPTIGSPYDPTNGNKSDRFFPGATNQYKRAASLYGDVRFQAGRRQLLDSGIYQNATPAAYSYAFMDPSPRARVALGVPHSSDLDVIFGNTRSPLTAVMARQWAAFTTRLDPNGNAMPNWPKYDHADPGRLLLAYKSGGTGIMSDTYRGTQMDFINSLGVRQLFNN